MKIAIAFSTFKKSKDLFRKIEKCLDGHLPFKVRHCPDGHTMKTDYFQIDAVPLTNKICGMRYDFIIIDDSISAEQKELVIRPLLTARAESRYIVVNSNSEPPRGFRRD